eukprot:1483767-Rhodomonas_salina.1
MSLVPTWSWRQPDEGEGFLERVTSDPPLWSGGERAWEMPYEIGDCGPEEVFSAKAMQCEPCPLGSVKEGPQLCTPYNASIGILLPFKWEGADGPMASWVVRVAVAGLLAVEHINNRSAALIPEAHALIPGQFKL